MDPSSLRTSQSGSPQPSAESVSNVLKKSKMPKIQNLLPSSKPRFIKSLEKDLGWIPKFIGGDCIEAAKNIKILNNCNLTPQSRFKLGLKATLNILSIPILVPLKAIALLPLLPLWIPIALLQASKLQIMGTNLHGKTLNHYEDWKIAKQEKPNPS